MSQYKIITRLGKLTPLLLTVVGSAAYAASPTPVEGENGMVVSASALANQAGIAIMQQGGSAVDAAAATGWVLAVTNPRAGNLGGGGFAVLHLATGEDITLDFREMAPSAAHRDMFLDENDAVVSGLSLRTHLASGVPGTVDGLLRLNTDHGSGVVSREAVMAAAIRYARDGFAISAEFARDLNLNRVLFAKSASASAIFRRPEGQPWRAGDRLVQPELAATLERISRNGHDGFYAGETADLFVAEMSRGNGIVTLDDLASYKAVYRPPVRGRFAGHEVISMGPPSSGGILVIQILNMLSQFDVERMGWNSSAYIHLLTEAERRAYADRATHLGDPDFWDVPVDRLIDPGYARERISNMIPGKATPSDSVSASSFTDVESTETTHYSVADAQGNAVSITTTLNAAYGSGIVVTGAGFFLNNQMDDFSAKPGVANLYGLMGNEANAIAPGKRMLSSMSPTIVLKDGRPHLVVGSPGGATIITTVVQVIMNVLAFDMNIQEAVLAPRVHAQWKPDEVMVELRAVRADVQFALERRGHTLTPYRWRYIGEANSIAYEKGMLYGAPDSRGQRAAATGY